MASFYRVLGFNQVFMLAQEMVLPTELSPPSYWELFMPFTFAELPWVAF